jgi:putative MATE family efflux protein
VINILEIVFTAMLEIKSLFKRFVWKKHGKGVRQKKFGVAMTSIPALPAIPPRPAVPAHYALKGDLTSGPVGRLLFKMTVPMIWGLAALISFQIADMYFVSRLGPAQLAAIGFTFPVTMFVLSLTIAMGISTSSIVSRRIGEGDRDGVRRLATHALMMTGMVGILIALIGIPLIGPVFRGMGATDMTLPAIHDFMTIYFAGAVFLALVMVGNAALRATGDTVSPALILTGCALLNLVLDPLLIYGLGGFPRLEMKGAAIANVVSEIPGVAVGLWLLARKKKVIGAEHLNFVRFGDSAKKFLTIAIPVGLANVLQPVTAAILTAMLAASGPQAVAAFGIIARVEAFAFIVIMALATGMAPIVGQNWGARQFSRVNATLKAAFAFAFGWSLAVALILAVAGRAIASAFTADPAVIHVALLYFWIVPVSYAFGNLVNGWGSAFNAMGLPKNAFLLIIVRLLVLTLPLAWMGHWLAGIAGLFGGLAAANILCGGVGFFLCWRIARRHQAEAAIIDA